MWPFFANNMTLTDICRVIKQLEIEEPPPSDRGTNGLIMREEVGYRTGPDSKRKKTLISA